MTLWQTITWDTARTAGFTAYVLLSLSVVLGLALSLQLQAPRWPRLINNELHNFVTLVSTVFVGVHVLAVWIDPFTRFSWYEVFVPFASHYRPIWMALGIVALYLGIAVGISTWLRPRIGYAAWRKFHAVTFVVYLLATAHGIAVGSDTRTIWAIALYAVSALVVGVLLLSRLITPAAPKGRPRPVLAALVAALLFFGAWWTAAGPLQSGWNATANNGQGNGARGSVPTSQPAISPASDDGGSEQP